MRVPTRLLTRAWLSSALLGFAVAAVIPATAPASPHASPVVGHVYVDDNTAGTTTRSGRLIVMPTDRSPPEAGSPFAAGGAGSGSGLASQGAIQITTNGTAPSSSGPRLGV
jgi:hypothetical protein